MNTPAATDPNSAVPPEWLAFGPEKEAWKAAGNRFTAAELAQLDHDSVDFTLTPAPRPTFRAD